MTDNILPSPEKTGIGGVAVMKLDDLLNWARLSSLWPMGFGPGLLRH
jgi:NADH-quinone oxidoreductase subunit B